MAKKIWNNPIDKNVNWGGDDSTEGMPVSGEMVQKYIKDSLNSKAGIFYYDISNNRYIVFSDELSKDEYLEDPTKTHLIIGTFDAPFNYTASINLTSKTYNAVFLNSTGNYIDFTFDVVNKQGASTGESVTVTYTFIRNANKQTVTETRRFGDVVHFNIDKYLGEGTNTIMVGITGQTSLAATTVAITYQVVNLFLLDDFNISKVYNLKNSSQQVEIPFTVSGYGTKIVEWYIDGKLLPFNKSEDEVVDVSTSRTKYITISNLNQGTHSLQIRAYTVINGEQFYTDTLYRDLIVYTQNSTDVIIGIATTIPREYGILSETDNLVIYGITQYVPYTLRFATYSPLNAANTEVSITVDGELKGVVGSKNNIENEFVFTSTTNGNKTLKLTTPTSEREVTIAVNKTSVNIDEIEGAIIDFTAIGKNNGSTDRDTWTDGTHTGTLTGFNWNNTSGWVNGRLEMSAGSSLAIDYAPLANNPTNTGKTIEIEWMTKNVTNDDAIICDLRGDNGVGILITATKVSMISADGVVIETEYKSDENIRLAFVINKSSGVTNRRLSFIYTNGIVSRAEQWAFTDNYTSNRELLFTATEEAEVSLKQIRIYDNALSSDNILNNFILYRDTIAEMMEVYDRNDVYEDGTTTFSPDKMMRRLPVMIVTGDIPTLENTSDKDTQIVVDIEYYNLQDPTKNFKMVGAAMRPQGTSSMGYPKKNFRIYTEKVDGTILYDHENKVVENKLYAFTENAQPVNCWCLKADYAESSGTHNTGIARLWNNALINAQIDGEYVCRTEAQKAAIAAGYQYDVRTTIDGFPILLFYRPSVDDSLIFIGKYNFNNDKSTESVFGFTGIPGFNNEKMQCWEILNNGNALALFTSTEGFDTGWSEAFESRYPDTKTPYTGDLKAFCEWMSTVTPEDFKTEKWEHLNMYMIAAYWVYLMRHAAADQFVKNAMLTSEDGQHFYFILYDNDTINGLINTGRLRISPTDGRQTIDETGSYVFAGHDSRLWNLLETDDEFKNLVSEMDNALYSAGISYANTIKVFDEDQADKWVARVYNQDAQYKYIGPYVEKGIDNLFMLQGKRDLHRKWWLAKRFSIFDAKYVSGTYKSQAIEVKCLNGTPSGQKFTIKAGYPIDYGYGINNIPRSFGIPLNIGDSHTFTTQEVINLGDPLRIYGAPNLAEVDFSQMSDRLAVMNIASVYDDSLKTKLTKLIVGSANKTNAELEEISGLKQAVSLEHLDIQGMTKMSSLDLSNHPYFKTLKAKGSGISSISFAKGAPVEMLELPSSIRVLSLNQLPYLDSDNIIFENISSLQQLNVSSCPNVTNDFEFVYNWVVNKTASNENCSLTMDGVDWSGVSGQKFYQIASLGAISLKGKVVLTDITEAQGILFERVFGNNVFDENAEFYIDAPTTITISGPTSVLEGDSATYVASVYPRTEGTTKFSLSNTRTGCSINADTGVLTTAENGLATSNIVVRATFTPSNGEPTVVKDYTVSIVKRTYPTNATITGNNNPILDGSYSWNTATSGVNGSMTATWVLSGDIVDYVEISDSSLNSCSIDMTYPPLGVVNGTLTLTLKKAYNGATILTTTKALSAELEGVIITGRSNAPIQEILYNAGLVANSTHTFESEAKAITAAQLQPGTAATTSIFYAKRNDITHFEEFRYFTGLTTIPKYLFHSCIAMTTISLPNTATSIGDNVFQKCEALSSIVLPNSLTSLGSATFYGCIGLVEITLPEGVTGCGADCFHDCKNLERLVMPSTFKAVGGNSFGGCGKLNFEVAANNNTYKDIDGVLYNVAGTTLVEYAKDYIQPNYTIAEGVITLGNYSFCNCYHLASIVLPSTLKTVGLGSFAGATKLSSITSNAVTAPIANGSDAFGKTTSNYTGRDTYNTGNNRLRIPLNASGYDAGQWLDPLQNVSKGGFSIHGKLILTSNKSDAQFDVKYTTEANTSKTVTVGVGTCYLSDIKYGTSLTATPKALGDNVFDNASTTITYNGATTITNNAYIYPKNATIVGEQNPTKNPTYTWTTTTVNVNGEYTATWALNGDVTSYISIASQDNESCTLSIIEAPTEEITGTLTLSIKPKVGNTVTTTKTLKALLPGVVITSKSNAPVQAALYAAGAVANETYSLKSELERITNCSTMFKRKGITTFDEFQYFTAVRTLPEDAFSGNTNLSRITIPKNVSTIATLFLGKTSSSDKAYISVDSANTSFASVDGVLFNKAKTTLIKFALGKTISNYTIPSSVTTIVEDAFYKCDVQTISCANALHLGTIWGCNKLTKLNFDIASITRINGIVSCSALQEISFADGFTTKATNMINGCKAISKITSKSVIAPTLPSGTFGDAGENNTSGTNRLILPINATGYESGTWAQLVTSNGFYIHGKLVITSNKSNAQFNVTYTTESGTLKTVTVGVGTWYLNDIKYSTNITIAAVTLSGYTWAEQTKTFTYSKTANTADFNAYIYPSSVAISGKSSIQGGSSETYTADITPSNFDVGVTYAWSLNDSSNASISSSSGNQCTITTNEVETEESLTLTCVVTTTDGKKVQKSFAIALQTRSNFVIATYDITSTSSPTNLLYEEYSLSNIEYMELDGTNITPSLTYVFQNTGTHVVKMILSTLVNAFREVHTLSRIDFSECDGLKYDSLERTLDSCWNLSHIEWGQCLFTNIKSLSRTFRICRVLPSIDLSPFRGAKVDVLERCFEQCHLIASIDLSPIDCSNVTSVAYLFSQCRSLTSINWGDRALSNVSNLSGTFASLHAMSSVDLTVFAGATITSTSGLFQHSKSIKTIIMPWVVAPPVRYDTFGSFDQAYVGRDTYDTGENKLYVPSNATGYNSGYWIDPLCNASKCGFTLSKTL